nr:reverse transcriptase domain-containing protein [Tanacetum cinerariifolium]
TRGRSGDLGNGRIDGQGGQVGGQGSEVNDGVDGVPDFSTITAQQLQNLLPTIEFLACNPKEYDGKRGVIVYTRWIEKMESVHDMSGCGDSQKVKYIAGSFVGKALTEITEKLFAEDTRIDVKQFRETLLLRMGNVKKSVAERTRHKRHGTKSDEHITSSNSRTHITQVVDADAQVPSAVVHLTAPHNVLANEQHHTDQSEPSYDTYLEGDSNTTPDSTFMSHRGGEIDQDVEQDQVKSPLLKAEVLKTNDMVEKEVYNELSNRFLQLEKHCISLEISIQQKEEGFQIDEGEPSRSTALGAATAAETEETTHGGGLKYSSNNGQNTVSQSFFIGGRLGVGEGGCGTSPELICAGAVDHFIHVEDQLNRIDHILFTILPLQKLHI